MSKLKGKKKLNKVVSAQLKDFGVKAKLSDEYAYYFSKALITFKLTENTIEDNLFNEFIFDRFGYEVKNTFMISILHEVGHHLANDEIDNRIYDFCMDEKDRIVEAIKGLDDYNEIKKLEYQYFNLPDEIMATQWAVNFARNNEFECDVMWENIKTALLKFYKKNGLTE
jgi:hypothetical protein